MKNYYEQGKKIGLNIYCDYDKLSKMIKSVSLNKKHNHVEIRYMGGQTKILPADEIDVEELKRTQKEQFYTMERDIEKQANEKIRYKSTITGIYWSTSASLILLGNIGGGIAWFTLSWLWFTEVIGPLKLRKEMRLVEWTYDNRDKVNEVIHEEIDAKIDKEKAIEKDMTGMIPVSTKFEFPEDSPYPERIYNEGIDLSNIDMLTVKQLRKLKRKASRKKDKRR